MIEPTSKAKAYCQKLIDTLVKEGYVTDAKIVEECLKKMNGEKVALATMDEKQAPKTQGKIFEDSYITPNKKFFQFIYDRLRYVHKENPNTDYMLSLKERISNMYYLEQSKSAFKASDCYASKVDGKIHDMTYTPKNKDEQVNWTEEDDHHWMMCLECVKECATQEREDFSKTIDWIKSLKQRIGQ